MSNPVAEVGEAPLDLDALSGLHYGLSDPDYRSANALNYSRLKAYLQSGMHGKAYDDGELEYGNADAFSLGSFLHTLTLEPEKIGDWAVAPEEDKRTKSGKLVWSEFEAINADRQIIKPALHAKGLAMSKAIFADADCHKMLTAEGDSEVSIFAELCGVRCKGRIDRLLKPKGRSGHRLLDVKTTPDASRSSFGRTVANYKYHMQAAFYLDMYEAVTGHKATWHFVAVEKTAPYVPAYYKLNEESIEKGRELYTSAIATLRHCVEKNEYVGYSTGSRTISIPHWAL